MIGVRTLFFLSFLLPHSIGIRTNSKITEYNPRYFDEPEKYKPSRWFNISNDEAFTAFSVGMYMVFRSTGSFLNY